jgi:hypothetical protein
MLAGWFGVVLGGVAVLATARPAAAEDAGAAKAAERAAAAKSGAELLPPTTLFYVEIQRPAEVIRLILDHPLRQRLEQSPDYQKAFDTPQFKEFQAIVNAVEQRSGVPWRKALETSTGGGLVVAVDAATQGLVVLSRSTDEKTTASVRDALFSLARDDAKSKGNPDPIQTKQYRGLTAYSVGESVVADVGPWLVVSNKPALGKAIADRILDGGQSLATEQSFVTSRNIPAHGGTPPTAWAFLRMAPVRLMSTNNPIFDASAKSDNPVAELLFGGLAGVLRNTDYLTMSLNLRDNGIKLTVASPNDPKWVPAGRGFFFAPPGQAGGADQPLKPKNTLLTFTTYRDLAAWWEAGPDTYTEGVAAKMAQADSGLSNFLGGKSFGTDVLGSFAPQIQFVVAAQDYAAAGVPQPTIRLPAGAMVFRLREKSAAKADIKKHFRVAFQSITALANLDGASKGRPLLEMKTEKVGQSEILFATYEAPSDEAAGADAKPQAADKKPAERDIYYNFSPALVLSGDRIMLCSTRQIAEELADLAAKPDSAKAPENTLIEIAAQPIGQLLKENREQLIAQNMLEKGHGRAEAEKEVDVFVTLVNAVKHARVSLTPTDKTISLNVEIETAPAK